MTLTMPDLPAFLRRNPTPQAAPLGLPGGQPSTPTDDEAPPPAEHEIDGQSSGAPALIQESAPSPDAQGADRPAHDTGQAPLGVSSQTSPAVSDGGGASFGGSAGRLRSYVQRVEKLREEIQALQSDVSEVYKEAEGDGYDKAAIKEVVSRRAKREKNPAKFAELSEIVDLYQAAVEGHLEAGTVLATRARARGDE